MPEERDRIDDLRQLWRSMQAPDPQATDSDPRTEAAVEWMRAGWSTLEAPVAVRPRRLGPHATPWILSTGAPLATAAALLLAVLLATHATLPAAEAPEIPEISDGASTEFTTTGQSPSTAIAALDRDDGELEVRRGSVRLILLAPEIQLADAGEEIR